MHINIQLSAHPDSVLPLLRVGGWVRVAPAPPPYFPFLRPRAVTTAHPLDTWGGWRCLCSLTKQVGQKWDCSVPGQDVFCYLRSEIYANTQMCFWEGAVLSWGSNWIAITQITVTCLFSCERQGLYAWKTVRTTFLTQTLVSGASIETWRSWCNSYPSGVQLKIPSMQ